MMDRITAPHNGVPITPSQPRWMKEAPIIEINKRSPRVVSSLRIPLRGFPPGLNFSQIIMTEMQVAMNMKKAAVCHVQAIQLNDMLISSLYAAHGKAFGYVVSNKPDNDSAGNNG